MQNCVRTNFPTIFANNNFAESEKLFSAKYIQRQRRQPQQQQQLATIGPDSPDSPASQPARATGAGPRALGQTRPAASGPKH